MTDAVHPSTVLDASSKPGCWNKLRHSGYWAPDRRFVLREAHEQPVKPGFILNAVFIPDRFLDRPCDRAEGARCEGCVK